MRDYHETTLRSHEAEEERLEIMCEVACQKLRDDADVMGASDIAAAIDEGYIESLHIAEVFCFTSLPADRRKALVRIARGLLNYLGPDDIIPEQTLESMASVLADKISERMGWPL